MKDIVLIEIGENCEMALSSPRRNCDEYYVRFFLKGEEEEEEGWREPQTAHSTAAGTAKASRMRFDARSFRGFQVEMQLCGWQREHTKRMNSDVLCNHLPT